MNDIHIRAILLTVIGFVSIMGGAWLKLAGYVTAPSVVSFVGLVSIVCAILVLMFADSPEPKKKAKNET